jgi:hypothetical protein
MTQLVKHVPAFNEGNATIVISLPMNLVIADVLVMPRTCCGVFLIEGWRMFYYEKQK